MKACDWHLLLCKSPELGTHKIFVTVAGLGILICLYRYLGCFCHHSNQMLLHRQLKDEDHVSAERGLMIWLVFSMLVLTKLFHFTTRKSTHSRWCSNVYQHGYIPDVWWGSVTTKWIPRSRRLLSLTADLSNWLGLLWKLFKFPSFLHLNLYTRSSACPSQEWRCSYTTGNYLAFSAKEDTFLFLAFLFLKPKNTSHTNPRYLFFPALPGLKGRNIAVRDSHFWLDSINTTPHSGNPQENSETANANFVLLPFITLLKEGFKQRYTSNSVHSQFSQQNSREVFREGER